jgi:hypothetical protein
MKINRSATALATASGLALALLASGNASAFSYGEIPSGSATNEGLTPIYGNTPRGGWYGGQVWFSGGELLIEYLGAESGYDNSFVFQGTTLITEPENNNDWADPRQVGAGVGVGDTNNTSGGADAQNLQQWTYNIGAAGLLDFSFISGGGEGSAVNGSNPDDLAGDVGPNFFATFWEPNTENALSGTMLDLWFDDTGANDDDNHDDMLIRLTAVDGDLTVVPIPAAAWLFGSALVGMAGIGYRRTRKQA